VLAANDFPLLMLQFRESGRDLTRAEAEGKHIRNKLFTWARICPRRQPIDRRVLAFPRDK